MKKLFLAVFVFVLLFSLFFATEPVKAQTEAPTTPTISYEKVNMKDGFSYLLKRAEEKITLFVLSYNSQKKLNYYEKLLNVRLAELKFIVDNKDIANIEVGSQRYFSTAGQLTTYLMSKPELSANKQTVTNLFTKHIAVIEQMEASYDNTTAEWRLLRDDANYLKDYSSLLNK